ncbi:MAG: hypothetical protein K0R59_3200 [Sphingobacterium sp.]|jgi:cbb3-type cytochrome oxidase subunit 3|uniref:hypothetical protein n=1 Tax=unclassified Sphingobacterium TaxID=2609468 RepID=UPI0009851139|nr:hypothetical protein [Sphingobacterium sp. CZ-UAM]MDF2517904.1 hypothetical protein [Sphingobacterium sp.]OOG18419.1 hypothetical protein BWD42_00015 [Sphingobacterium sp. CZ-UAM]
MFKQITNLNGSELYLIVSLWIFLIFFISVTIMLFRMKKDYVNYMKELPLEEETEKEMNHSPESI